MVFLKIISGLGILLISCTLLLSRSSISSTIASVIAVNNDRNENDEKSEEVPQIKKQRYAYPLNSRDIDVSITSDWPTTDLSPLCETWAHLDDMKSFSRPNKNDELSQRDDLIWNYMDRLADLDSENRNYLDSALLNTESSSWIYDDTLALAIESAKYALDTVEDNVQTRLLKYALSLRAHSPLCELHRTWAREVAIQSGLYNPNNPIHQNQIVPSTFAVFYPSGKVVNTLQELTLYYENFNTKEQEFIELSSILLPNEIPRSFGKSINDENENAPIPTIILCTHLGTSAFVDFYKELKRLGSKFVVRHMGAIDYEETKANSKTDKLKGTKTILQGYGIRLDIKNMEYRAYDDKHEKYRFDDGENSIRNLTFIKNEYLAGINLAKLSSRENSNYMDKDQTSSLATLQTKLQQSHDLQHEMEQIIPPTWQTRILPLQAAAVISASHDPLISLQDIAQNLPSRASSLINVHVPQSIQEAAAQIEQLPIIASGNLQSAQLTQAAPFGFFVNGKRIYVERPSFNIFELLNTLRKEDMILTDLEASFDFSSVGMYHALQKAFQMGDDYDLVKSASSEETQDTNSQLSDQIRIDVGRGGRSAIIYANDIEKDPQYNDYMPSLTMLAYGYTMIKRNLFTFLIVLDPLDGNGAPALRFALYLLQTKLSLRIGILMVNDDDLDSYSLSENKDDWACAPLPNFNDEAQLITTGAFLEIFTIILSKLNGHAALSFLFHVTETLHEMKTENRLDDLSIQTFIEAFSPYFRTKHNADLRQLLKPLKELWNPRNPPHSLSYMKSIKFAELKGLKRGMSFFNGIPLPIIVGSAEEDKVAVSHFQERAMKISSEETQLITQLVMAGVLTDRTRSIYAKLLTGTNVYKKFHPLLMEVSPQQKTYVDNQHITDYPFMYTSSASNNKKKILITLEAFLDLESPEGLKIAEQFLIIIKTLHETPDTELEHVSIAYRIIPNSISSRSSLVGRILRIRSLPFSIIEKVASAYISAINKSVSSFTKTEDTKQQFIMFLSKFIDIDEKERDLILDEMEEESSEDNGSIQLPFLGKLTSQNVVTANGRVFVANKKLDKEDIILLINLEKQRSVALSGLFQQYGTNEDSLHSAVAKVSAYLSNVITSSTKDKRIDVVSQLDGHDVELKNTVSRNPLHFAWNDAKENINNQNDRILKTEVVVIMDPLSEPAQRASSIIIAVRDELKLPLHVIIAPRTQIDGNNDLPLTTYYRFFATFQTDLKANKMPSFQNLPSNHVLTLRTDVPEPWNVQKVYAAQDTDNLRCDVDFSCGDNGFLQINHDDNVLLSKDITTVEFGLNSLMFFGHCINVANGDHPNGLQLTLTKQGGRDYQVTNYHNNNDGEAEVEILNDGTASPAVWHSNSNSNISINSNTDFSDTLVMKTLGYWQLRANPGVWNLAIAKNTIGSKAFEIAHGKIKNGRFYPSRINSDTNVSTTSKTIVMKDFVNREEALFVKPAKQYSSSDVSLGESVTDQPITTDEDILHVFSLATGHLYERLLKIMMLSVTKRASIRVKFWLFENYLSPGFKGSVMAMAHQIGFDVEFVTYKWPEWLRGQSEMQRIIWGYKILFLDVLFPLDVKKIIYVDADQVVRADLKELRDLDLKGAPYGYTPFCDSRESTLGYQFWRTGFWESHLRGKPYHISALYVVDLERFRKEKVGDTLRGIYQMLSADPNSLSNLDQDLPNYAQHEVKIHSLPQEWLWCESWCADSTKKKAKTIDLCNNPLHKEPKLTMAKRVISGNLFKESWIELDAEIERYDNIYLTNSSRLLEVGV